ncbi:inositol monophosphatase family protein [Hydrocarboniclastica marina]|uniref:Inositol monophosphatase n=1 Tax=Hydrocarboniclastica marina TaxID=2259620 RepID=A0A4P7XFW4_9ALTE|nr:inositol monophosphatase family protein [Hydrocarboniclastica marina]MAL98367.1 inositol monophosphatase [Alteromonadaceae bacterium]QCF25869.1 inositol monophosphatase [Hydrocarboniclastica marina]|tara:strand:+ start:2102 stop:2905 length:804 start_codon:yes stop_codon:yes gene_type:complete
MQPATKMALRVARQSSDFLKSQFGRRESGGKEAEAVLQQAEQVKQAVYDNCLEQLQKSYREHYFAPMGDSDAQSHEKSWHVFPLLGESNYLRGIPDFGIALLEKQRNRGINLALIFPMLDEEFTASKGYGATANGRRIRVAEQRHLGQCVVATNVVEMSRRDAHNPVYGEVTTMLAESSLGLRWSGCAVLEMARVAAGQLDAGAIIPEGAPCMAIGLMLLNEAGALSSDFAGNPSTEQSRQLVTANNRLFKEVLKALNPYRARLNQS